MQRLVVPPAAQRFGQPRPRSRSGRAGRPLTGAVSRVRRWRMSMLFSFMTGVLLTAVIFPRFNGCPNVQAIAAAAASNCPSCPSNSCPTCPARRLCRKPSPVHGLGGQRGPSRPMDEAGLARGRLEHDLALKAASLQPDRGRAEPTRECLLSTVGD